MDKYPSLQEALNKGKSMSEVRELYVKQLRKDQENLQFNLYANKLEETGNMLNASNMRELEAEFHELKKVVGSLSKENKISISLKRRQKDFIGLNEKIRLFLKENKPLGRLQDFLGFRLILLTGEKDTINSVGLCYKVLNELINFFVVKRGCLPAEASPIWDTGFNQAEHPEIIVPKEAMISEKFKPNVKDYIVTPKKNGYQSLHLVIKKHNGLVFEIQVRTMSMDIRAEHGSATHILHKSDRYKDIDLEVDLSNVSIPGFSIVKVQDKEGENERIEIYDEIGLCKSIDPFNIL